MKSENDIGLNLFKGQGIHSTLTVTAKILTLLFWEMPRLLKFNLFIYEPKICINPDLENSGVYLFTNVIP